MQDSKTTLVNEGTETIYPCFGADSGTSSNLHFHKREEAATHPRENRQYDIQSLHINHVGGIHSPTLNAIASAIWCPECHPHLTAEYLPGAKNHVADEESRHSCDWMLHPQVFKEINETMGPLKQIFLHPG